ncbi:SDR family oxidoreductase [Streptomyces sp. NPDC002659]|uniref:SDR family oxidoreductase n=1 Tax=Streptomyces sp. NPDC002659 TaxID=3364656 RepID=UPI00367B75AC
MNHRTAVIVGAGHGVGRETALAMVRAGMNVVAVCANNTVPAKAPALPHREIAHATLACDFLDEAAITEAMRLAADRYGSIDVLVNAVGGAVPRPFEQLSLDEWETQIHTGLTAVFLACKHAVGHMRKGGLIVNVASMAAKEPYANWSAYVAARHGLLGFSATIREELRGRGIAVTVITPGATDGLLEFGQPEEWDSARMLSSRQLADVIVQTVQLAPHAVVVVEELCVRNPTGRMK